MNRRQFLGAAFAASAASGMDLWRPARLLALDGASPAVGPYGTAHRASVTDFGADPTGAKDATEAVRKAIAALAQRNARLVFPPGHYSFAGEGGVAMSFHGYEGLEVFGNGAELSFAGAIQPLLMRECNNVEIHDLKVDWARPPFSHGTVVESAGSLLTVQLDPEFPLDSVVAVADIAEYDAKTGLPVAGGTELAGSVVSAKLAGKQRLVLGMKRAVALKEGTRLVLFHHAGGPPCFQLQNCDTALLESVVVHASPGAGVLLEGCRELSFADFRTAARAGSRRWISVNGDGVRMVDCQGSLVMKRCAFERTGHSGVEMYQSYWRLKTRTDDRSALIEAQGSKPLADWQLPEAGSILQLSEPAQLKLLGEIAVAKAESTPAGTKITFKESLSPVVSAGTLLCNALSQPRAVIDECSFTANCNNGVLSHGRVRVTNSHFTQCAGAAIAMAADEQAMRGPTVQSVAITDNTFSDCNYAPGELRGGTITVDAVRGAAEQSGRVNQDRVNQGIMIQRNRFSGDAGPAIECAAASWVTIEGNTFGTTDLLAAEGKVPRAIVLRNVDQSFLEQNQSKTNQSILLIGCTDKVQTSENGLLAEVRSA